MREIEKAKARVLIVDDYAPHADAVADVLGSVGHHCVVLYDAEEAIERLKRQHFDVVVSDLMFDGAPRGLDVLAAARQQSPGTEVILITAHSSVETCRTALKEGAFDYIEKAGAGAEEVDPDDLRAVVARAAERTAQQRVIRELREQLDERYGFENIVAHSPAMVAILQTVRRMAPSNLPILIEGESGTGKDLLAQAIHNASRRRENRLVALNCAGLSETLLEDELFGHVKGAYTGAAADRKGRFEYADGGTMFLDEVGDMPLAMQAKLLRVLENGEVVRVGSNEPLHVDVRVVSATNTQLEQRVKEDRFRQDLFFRLNGVTLTVPPLRERREDIPLLIDHFIDQANRAHGTKITGIVPAAQRALVTHEWPGNVRQLRNVVENMVVLADEGKLGVEDLPLELRGPA
ncbi:MAG TPA: sigma-54 dependent transcriptional regulator, partial [Phycisphaerae bacterium]|nr:sigma-54 dependent transcriptional regulator [Phycisphaerae bacterium]